MSDLVVHKTENNLPSVHRAKHANERRNLAEESGPCGGLTRRRKKEVKGELSKSNNAKNIVFVKSLRVKKVSVVSLLQGRRLSVVI